MEKEPTYIPDPNIKWESVEYRRFDFEESRIESYCSALKTIYVNGDAQFFAFEATDKHAFLSAIHFDHRAFETPVRSFLLSRAVQECFVPIIEWPWTPMTEVKVIHKGHFEFEGFLADVLLQGGAYKNWSGSPLDAKRLAEDCVAGLRSLAPQAPWSPFVIVQAWCAFFNDIAWDYTFIVVFPNDARIALVCATDTD